MTKLIKSILILLLSLFIFHYSGAQVYVNSTAGVTAGTMYATLGAAFSNVNQGVHQGVINIEIRADITEPGMATLNGSGNGAASYSRIVIRPGAGTRPTVTGSIGFASLIRLYGASNVEIDGSNNGTDSRDLTFHNTSPNSPVVLHIGSVGAAGLLTNVMIKNLIIINGSKSTHAILAGDANAFNQPGNFTDLSIVNNDVRNAFIGIYIYGIAGGSNRNVQVKNNDLNVAGMQSIGNVGIYAGGVNGIRIDNNRIGNFDDSKHEDDYGIWLAQGTRNAIVVNNTISNLKYTLTSSNAPEGMYVSLSETAAGLIIENNTINNLSSSGTGLPKGIHLVTFMSGITIRGNKISNISNSNAAGHGAAGILLRVSNAASDVSVYNNFIWDIIARGKDAFGADDNGNGIVVDGGGGYKIDHNSVMQNSNATFTGNHRSSCLLITSNATDMRSIDVRNNIFANFQTAGLPAGRPAMVVMQPGVLRASDYNVFHSVANNLVTNGTLNANSVADVQAITGNNANSLKTIPVFVSANDLHLSPTTNTQINGMAPLLAGIASDIDNDPRTGSVDPGADEFTPCLPVTINTQPQPATVCAAQNTHFSLAVANANVFQWQVDDGTGFADITDNAVYSNATTARLEISAVPASYDGYKYRCMLSFGAGCPTVSTDIAVLKLNSVVSVTAHPQNISVPNGTTANLKVTVSSNTTVAYQWQENTGSGFVDINNGAAFSGVNTDELKVVNAVIANNGFQYRCVIRNSCNTTTSNAATLTVTKLSQNVWFNTQTDGATITAYYGDMIDYTASTTSGDRPGYTFDLRSCGRVAGDKIEIIGVGTLIIEAQALENATYQGTTPIKFTIISKPKPIVVTATAQTKTYGDPDPVLTYTYTPSLVGPDVFTGSVDRVPGENAGNYAIQQNTLALSSNYALTYNSNDLVISKRTLRVTADDHIRAYGTPNPPLSFSYSGFIPADNTTVLTSLPVASTTATINSAPGDYPITLAGGSADNYAFSFVAGKLTIQQIQVQVIQEPVDREICAGFNTSFNTTAIATPGIAPVSYQWQYSYDGRNWTDLSQANNSTYITRSDAVSGYLRCKISVPGGEYFSRVVELKVNPLPQITAVASNDLGCAGNSAQLTATGGISYEWLPAYGLNNNTSPRVIATPAETTTYLVIAKDVNGCLNTARVTVNVLPSEYNVPNAFTPNNDGKNDCWGFKHWQKASEFTMSIYNRWGGPVFQTKDISKCWDGTLNGMPQATGSFVYYVRAVTPCGVIEKRGTLMLIR